MEQGILTTTVLPISLFIIMIGMGLSLTLGDFKRVVRYPRAVMIGLVNQLILLPIIAYILVQVIPLSPTLMVGMMLLAACPGGATSNLIAHVAKGDIALSVTLTAISSFITVFTIPIIVSWALLQFMGQSQTIELPLFETMGKIFGITALPVSIGMFVRSRNQAFADRMERPMRIASTVIFVLIILGIVVSNWQLLLDSLKVLGVVTLVLNLVTMLLGYVAARLFGLNLRQTISIAIESGIQNGTLAIVVASAILLIPELSLPAVVYSIFMFLTGGFMMWYFGNSDHSDPHTSTEE